MGDVRKLWIEAPAGRMEAALRSAAAVRAAAVLAHPHPLQGGSLHNPVVFHCDRSLHRAGLATLRFNFRGVGSSDGTYDGGRGEVEDVGAALSWIRGIAPGLPLFLVGYSFGAWCGLRHAIDDAKLAGLVAVGLPVSSRFPIPGLERLPCPLVVVQGSEDEFGDPVDVRALLRRSLPEAELRLVEGASHLFPDRARDAAREVVAAVQGLLGTRSRRGSG